VSSEQLFPDDVKDATATAKVVYGALRRGGPLTTEDLVSQTGQSRRAVERALEDLTESGVIDSRPDLTDPRRHEWLVEE